MWIHSNYTRTRTTFSVLTRCLFFFSSHFLIGWELPEAEQMKGILLFIVDIILRFMNDHMHLCCILICFLWCILCCVWKSCIVFVYCLFFFVFLSHYHLVQIPAILFLKRERKRKRKRKRGSWITSIEHWRKHYW